MKLHPNTPFLPHLSWQRQGLEWKLVLQQRVLARIIPDHRRWLCYSAVDNGDDGLLGPAHSLAAAKAFLTRQAFVAMRHEQAKREIPL